MKKILCLIIVITLGLSMVACNPNDNGTEENGTNENEGAGETKGEVELSYVEWDSEISSTNVVKAVLQEKMGYDVKITPVSAAAMWTAVATSDVDGMVAAWLPTTHGHFLEDNKDDVVDLGPNLEGTYIGLVVPEYVTINSIEEMNDNAEKFNGEIIGIDPGAGIMSTTETAIQEYGLNNFELVEGSGATMTAALEDAIEAEDWVVVTGWTPHWKFGKWSLKYLEDPKGVYGEKEQINTIVRKGLEEDMPEVYAFLDAFNWAPSDMEAVMAEVQGGKDPYEAAKEWIAANEDKVNEWIK